VVGCYWSKDPSVNSDLWSGGCSSSSNNRSQRYDVWSSPVSYPFFKIRFSGLLTHESVSSCQRFEVVCGAFNYVQKYVI
jgi:hypothetical protein